MLTARGVPVSAARVGWMGSSNELQGQHKGDEQTERRG